MNAFMKIIEEGKELCFEVIDSFSGEVLFKSESMLQAKQACDYYNFNVKLHLNRKINKKTLRAKLLALIHCDENYKQIKEAGAWEDWLSLRFGVMSCKDLNEAELGNVLDILSSKCPDRDYILRKGTATKSQIKTIYAIMKRRGFSPEAKKAFFIKQIGVFKPDTLLSKDEATKIIIGLQKISGDK